MASQRVSCADAIPRHRHDAGQDRAGSRFAASWHRAALAALSATRRVQGTISPTFNEDTLASQVVHLQPGTGNCCVTSIA